MKLGSRTKLTEEETRQLISETQNGSEEALEQLTLHSIGLIKAVVKRQGKPLQEQEDLFQLGAIGLMKAVRGFDLDSGYKFSTYAYPTIDGEIRKFLRDKGNLFKIPRDINVAAGKIHVQELYDNTPEEVMKTLGLEKIETAEFALQLAKNFVRSIDEPFKVGKGDKDAVTLADQLPDDVNNHWFDEIVFRDSFKVLNERERKIITLRYYEDRAQHEIAPTFGVSQVQISRIERKALAKLREQLVES